MTDKSQSRRETARSFFCCGPRACTRSPPLPRGWGGGRELPPSVGPAAPVSAARHSGASESSRQSQAPAAGGPGGGQRGRRGCTHGGRAGACPAGGAAAAGAAGGVPVGPARCPRAPAPGPGGPGAALRQFYAPSFNTQDICCELLRAGAPPAFHPSCRSLVAGPTSRASSLGFRFLCLSGHGACCFFASFSTEKPRSVPPALLLLDLMASSASLLRLCAQALDERRGHSTRPVMHAAVDATQQVQTPTQVVACRLIKRSVLHESQSRLPLPSLPPIAGAQPSLCAFSLCATDCAECP